MAILRTYIIEHRRKHKGGNRSLIILMLSSDSINLLTALP